MDLTSLHPLNISKNDTGLTGTMHYDIFRSITRLQTVKKKKIKIYRRIETLRPSTRTSQFHLSQIQHLLNPRIRVPPNTAPCCTTSAAEETERKLEKAGLSRGFGVPIQPRGKVKEGKRKKKGGHPDRLNSVVSAAIKLFLKYSHITGRWYANIPVPGLCRPLPRSDYSL